MKTIVLFITSLILISCSRNTDCSIREIDISRIDNHVINTVEQYITKNPKFDNYIVDTEIPDVHDVSGFLGDGIFITISHYDDKLFGYGEWSFSLHPSSFFMLKGKKVYIISNLDYLLTRVPIKRNCEKINFAAAWNHYFKDAIMYYISADGEVMIEDTRPDTLFFPKIREVDI